VDDRQKKYINTNKGKEASKRAKKKYDDADIDGNSLTFEKL
jgi:hypothetical protein